MSQERAALLLLKGAISELPQDQQDHIAAAKVDILDALDRHEEGAALMAISLVSLEKAIENE